MTWKHEHCMKADTRHDPVFMNVLCSCFKAPQSSIMNVLTRRRGQMLCLISLVSLFLGVFLVFLLFWIRAWNVLLYKLREDNEKFNIGYGQRIHFSGLALNFQHYTLLIFKPVVMWRPRRGRGEGGRMEGCVEKLIMFCEEVYILFSNWYSRNRLLFWGFVFSFYLNVEKKKNNIKKQLLNTKKKQFFCFKKMWNYFILWDIFVSAYQCISM